MKRLLLALLMVYIGSFSLHAQSGTRNGNWWVQNSNKGDDGDLHQLMYLEGYLTGLEQGLTDEEAEIIVNRPQAKGGTLDACTQLAVDSYKKESRYTDGITNGQVFDGLNEFYKDYRNRSISIEHAIQIVLKSIKGEDVDRLIILYRQIPQ